MPFSYSGDPASSPTDAVRFEIQDTISTSPLLQDAEIQYSILQESGTAPDGGYSAAQILSAAAHCCEALVRRFGMQADTVTGSLRITYSKQADQFATRAKELRARAQGMQGPYVGGLSVSDMAANKSDPDRVQPKFTRSEFDNHWAGRQDSVDPVIDLGPPFGQ
jgi:hypothetical protein